MKIVRGDLFEHRGDCIAHGVNTLGVWGAGIAVEFKRRFPEAYQEYRDLVREHREHWKRSGVTSIVVCTTEYEDGYDVASIFSQDRITGKQPRADLGRIVKGLAFLCDKYHDIGIPAIGCGLGGLVLSELVVAITENLGEKSDNITLYIL